MRQLTLFDDLILTPRADQKEVNAMLKKLRKRGAVIGTDEAGRGALAGPVFGASVYLTPAQEKKLLALKLRDSKKMTHNTREKLFEAMQEMGVLWEVHQGTVQRIERDNILQASLWAMGMSAKKIAEKLDQPVACVVVDGTERIPKLEIPQWTLIMADNLVPAVSAASIVAKVLRDRLMTELSPKYPEYNFAQNKGYPTAEHMDTVARIGMCKAHRPYFCKKIIELNRGGINAVD